jgi:hypothetical protein
MTCYFYFYFYFFESTQACNKVAKCVQSILKGSTGCVVTRGVYMGHDLLAAVFAAVDSSSIRIEPQHWATI